MILRALAILLAFVLAIIELTHGFTLRYEYVRPHDLTAAETGVHVARHELKRHADVINDEFSVAPIQEAVEVPLTVTEAFQTAKADEQDEGTNVANNSYVKTSIDNVNDSLPTTVVPNELLANNITTRVDFTTDRSSFKELKRIYNTSPVTNIEKEISTSMTTLGVNDYIEASANEASEKAKSLDMDRISPTIASSTDALPNIIESELQNTTIVSSEHSETTTGWKKYTKIERKPVNITEEEKPVIFERVGDSLNAHTTLSRVSLEKAFDLVPDILSLQELRTHLMDSTNTIQSGIDLQKNNDERKINTKPVSSQIKEAPKAVEIIPTAMVSLRAGYLNHTKLSTEISTSANRSGAGNENEVDDVANETTDLIGDKQTQNMTSDSQKVKDALKENILEEVRLDGKVEHSPTNFTYLHTSTDDSLNYAEVNEVTAATKSLQVDQAATQNKHIDDLSVKPINNEKKTLYAVNPNYKPLKKIDVQPMKPFMRDPDDNSWRNESLSSLGIVFKGKNSSKAFTEVLKNKTEIVMSNLTEQEKTIEKVELRDRLEKIAEKRKSKKKKTDKYGNMEYGDYEENNSGDTHSSKEKLSLATVMSTNAPTVFTKTVEWVPKEYGLEEGFSGRINHKPKEYNSGEGFSDKQTYKSREYSSVEGFPDKNTHKPKECGLDEGTPDKQTHTPIEYGSEERTSDKPTHKPKENASEEGFPVKQTHTPFSTHTTSHTFHDYYDSKDDDPDYAAIPNMDILKSTPRPRVQWPVTQKILDNAKPMRQFLPDRQPTVQYFPPRPKAQAGNVNRNLNENLKQRFGVYELGPGPKSNKDYKDTPEVYPGKYRIDEYVSEDNRYRTTENKNHMPPIQHIEYRPVEDTDDRAFVIRNYKDILESIIKDTDYDRNANSYHAAAGATADEGKAVKSEEYDYGQRKEDLNTFVDNFNQNHGRFKADFPILFNTSIVHGSESGKVLASSSAVFKRLYSSGAAAEELGHAELGCDNVTVELAPAYELHYYVPEQEETADHTLSPVYPYRT